MIEPTASSISSCSEKKKERGYKCLAILSSFLVQSTYVDYISMLTALRCYLSIKILYVIKLFTAQRTKQKFSYEKWLLDAFQVMLVDLKCS